ncbi:hypothetical protein AB1N83_014152 [Pleurotus pulmonarius]
MTPPNQLPWTQHQPDALPSRQASYEYQLLGSTTGIRMIPPLSETPVAASRFHGAMPDTEHGFALGEPDPPSMFPAGSNARLIQNFGLDPQHVGSVPVMPLNSNRPNSEYNIFPIEFHPWPTAIPWIAPEAGQATLNDPVARDGDYTTLRDGNMPTVVPPREVYPVTTYPAGIATELSEVTLEGFMTRGSGNSTLWNEGGPSVQPESPMSERRPFSTPALFHGPMDAVGYNYSPFLPSSNQGQMPQPAQGVNLNARVVRPKIGTPASALEAERRRVHPSRFHCDHCPDKFTSKANRDRHHFAHLGVKPYTCPCGKSFTAKADLRRHRNRNGGGCPFSKLLPIT